VTSKNRIMIYGPKTDGTYVVEFRTAEGESFGDLNTENRDCGDPALPRADALRAVRAGCRGWRPFPVRQYDCQQIEVDSGPTKVGSTRWKQET
jgi:hypothetical protein